MAKKEAKEKVEEKQMEGLSNTPAVQGSKLPSEATDLADWGTSQVSSNDIIIPRILLMQGMSKKVTDGDAVFGEFRESLNNELLGKFDKGFEVVPFHMEKVFVEFDANDPKKKEFIRIVPITPANENLPYEDEGVNKKGEKCKISRDRTMNFYVLLVSELENGAAIPYIISARRSSLQAGKKLATQMFVKNAAARKNPAAVVCEIFATKDSNDDGTFAVLDMKPKSATKPEYVQEAFNWLQLVKKGQAKAHEESYNEEAATENVQASGESVDKGPARF